MRQSFHPAGWWKIIVGGLAGAALVSVSSLVSRGSQQAGEGPLSEKFWPSEFGRDDQRGAANRITPAKVKVPHGSSAKGRFTNSAGSTSTACRFRASGISA